MPLEFRESRVADFETNLFFLLKDKEQKSPDELWKEYQKELEEILTPFDVELKNGFLNLFFKKDYLITELNKILDEKQTNPDIDRSTELEALHHSLNELI